MQLQLIHTTADLLAYRCELSELCDLARAPTVYQSFDWIEQWLTSLAQGRTLWSALAWEDKTLVGLFPLLVDHEQHRGISLKVLRFIGFPDADYSDFILRDESAQAAIELWCAELLRRKREWDLLVLKDFFHASTNLPLLECVLKRRRVALHKELDHRCYYISTEGRYEEYLRKIPKNTRKSRRFQDKLSELGPLEFRFFGGDQPLPSSVWAQLCDLHRECHHEKREFSIVRNDSYASFYTEFIARCADARRLAVWVLLLDGRVVASFLGTTQLGGVSFKTTVFDSRLCCFSPSKVLLHHILEECFANPEIHRVELGRADYRWKHEWTRAYEHNSALTLFSPRIVPCLFYLYRTARQYLRHLFTRTPPPMFTIEHSEEQP